MKITHVVLEEDEEREIVCLEILEGLCDKFEFELAAPMGHRIFDSIDTPRVKKTPLELDLNSSKMLRNVVVLSRTFASARPDVIHFHSRTVPMISARIAGVKRIVSDKSIPSSFCSFLTLPRFLRENKGGVNNTVFNLSGERTVVFDVRGEEYLRFCLFTLSSLLKVCRVKGVFILKENRNSLLTRISSSLGILDEVVCLSPSDAYVLNSLRPICLVCMTDGTFMPLSPMYFASLGIPSLVPRRSALSSFVRDGVSGLHFSLSYSSLADCILNLCLDAVFCNRLSFGAYGRFLELSQNGISSQYLRLYTSLVT